MEQVFNNKVPFVFGICPECGYNRVRFPMENDEHAMLSAEYIGTNILEHVRTFHGHSPDLICYGSPDTGQILIAADTEKLLEELKVCDMAAKNEDEPNKDIEAATDDMVNHPAHYTGKSVECIDWIGTMLTDDEFYGYLKGNILKYLWRFDHKGQAEQDLGKAGWYLERLKGMVSEDGQ